MPRGLVDQLTSIGWGTLAHESGRQRVFGAVTRPWEANVHFTPLAPEAFASFAEPGLVKIAWTLEAEPDPRHPGVTVLRTETRAAERTRMHGSAFAATGACSALASCFCGSSFCRPCAGSVNIHRDGPAHPEALPGRHLPARESAETEFHRLSRSN